MHVLLSHPTGNQNVRAIMKALHKADILAEYDTTVAYDANSAVSKVLPSNIKTELARRNYEIPQEKIKSFPWLELARMIVSKLGFHNAVTHETGWASIDSVYKNFDEKVAQRLLKLKDSLDAVYAYEDGAFSTFKSAQKMGLKCIYDLPIAYWETGRELLCKEAERLPSWKPTLSAALQDSEAKLERKTQEVKMADVVVVASGFVYDSLPQWVDREKVIISPFGTPNLPRAESEKSTHTPKSKDRPMRILFVGSMSQRKGLGDLFEAVKMLNTKNIQLVVLGSLQAPLEFYKKEFPDFVHEANRPHHKVLELMRSCDVFCLPSIVEGRALVMQEAMSQGLPIIITPNTGGKDLVIEGDTGFMVPIQAPEEIAEKIDWFLNNRDKIAEMGFKAQQHALNYSWEGYGQKIVENLYRLLP